MVLFLFAAVTGPDPVVAQDEGPALDLVEFAGGFAVPVALTQPDDGSGRVFVIDQTGQIWELDARGERPDRPFLDVSDRLVDLDPDYDERGLLGLAFHPDFDENGRFFVYYSAPLREDAPEGWDHTSHISEFVVSGGGETADPDSERLILAVDQPYSNHNAGQIAFGPDGYLYIPLGDGGNAGDRDAEGEDLGRPSEGNAQNIETLLGSILRIDVDSGEPYGIPEDNVFAGDPEGRDEIFAYGFRNPYGLSFDLETGDMYAADAGQARFEEISRVEPGGNHGWNIREGTHCFDPDDFLDPPAECAEVGPRGEPLVNPVVEYERGPESGSVVVPGILYRGSAAPELQGMLVFGDYGSIRFLPTGVIYAAEPTPEGLWPIEQVSVRVGGDQSSRLDRFLLGVYQDLDGEMYLLTSEAGGPAGNTGVVYRVEAAEDRDMVPLVPIAVVVGVAVLAAAALAASLGGRRREKASSGEDVS